MEGQNVHTDVEDDVKETEDSSGSPTLLLLLLLPMVCDTVGRSSRVGLARARRGDDSEHDEPPEFSPRSKRCATDSLDWNRLVSRLVDVTVLFGSR